MKKENEKIDYLQYRTIEKGFYEVYAVTDFHKKAIEGNVCSGVLLSLMEQTKKDKGKIVRVKHKDEWDFLPRTKKIEQENISLKKELKKYKKAVRRLKHLM